MYQSDPPATGFLKSALPGSRNYCAERGVVKRPLNVTIVLQLPTLNHMFIGPSIIVIVEE